MARIRPGRCYRRLDRKPFTRISIRRPRKGYVKGVPASKIHKFEVGNPRGNFPLTFYLISKDSVQIRSNALESARITASKHLENNLGKNNYFLKILIFPHHVLRENKMATGAGADRYSEGMRRSFGKPVGTAARVRKKQNLIKIKAPLDSEKIVKEALRKASQKFPCSCIIKGLI